VRQESLFRKSQREAEQHKYLESQKAGRDLGASTIEDWQRRHWTLWLRHHWVEHLLGKACWEEFGPAYFGRLRTLFASHQRLLNEVVTKVRRGAENIDVLCWAATEGRDMGTVVRMLVELRLNEIRCTRFCFTFAKHRR